MTGKKLTKEEFVKKAIKNLRKPPYKGIHTVYSGFNKAFRDYFDEDPVEATKELSSKGIIVTRFAKGGAQILLPEDAPDDDKALKKILG